MIYLKQLLEERNRGILLDCLMFFVNLILLHLLSDNFQKLTKASGKDLVATVAIGGFFLGLPFLLPIGAILKRRGYHLYRQKDLEQDSPGCFLLPL